MAGEDIPEYDDAFDYDVVVIGSGFGGSVSALRLTEKGYRVAVLEAGRRFTRAELPRTSWDTKNYLWAPALGLYGIQRIHLLANVLILAGAGVGGGSLNYANTLYVPPKAFFEDRQWQHITDWESELAPFYDQAQRMLGVRTNPTMTPSDVHLKAAAEQMGVGDTFHLAPVGVFFGDGKDAGGTSRPKAGGGTAKAVPGGEVADPYFGGEGPSRRACTECGECMTGCRHGAKNTLTENYLFLAEKNGAEIHPLTTVERLRPLGDGFAVDVRRTNSRAKDRVGAGARTITAARVVVAAGTYGTQTLLHRMRDGGHLPGISAKLGELTRTNSEAIVGASTTDKRYGRRVDFTRGVAITSSIHPDANTHIEPVRYGRGSNAMGALSVQQVPGAGRGPRWLRYAVTAARHPVIFARSMNQHRWSEKTIIGLVMQSLDNSITVSLKKGGPGKGKLTSTQGHGAPNPTWIPAAEQAANALAAEINGFSGGTIGEIFDIPLTAHFIGGCPIAADAEHGVVDPYHRLFGYPGISVVDGSAISANLGVNPSLTITAQAERAMSMWPNRGEEDQRPAQEEAYRPVPAVRPARPAVPAGAFGELLLPVPKVPPRTEELEKELGKGLEKG
ncbi:cholesterol oxidase [Kitasatospora sp. MMS16-BH015]|uniref:GMC family oxidoreductase N-terminal domain-containing protein n=1 Tax=Kitasatospora sp. MMS16-BH015 TaxID=2018025 RepID=UPI000CA0EEA9|nr:GMC family oxidoreductase [Kitasatospora sp. MMS16-BH015]AUG77707.1 cholesterol oxidase [Kitasatospora sp. MMS16-BH015]